MGRVLAVPVILLLFAGCGEDVESDAYGQFEATEITVSSESAGKLLRFDAKEGTSLTAGVQVGLVDTTRLFLTKKELVAGIEAARTRITGTDANVEVVRERLNTAESDLKRVRALFEDGAATEQQFDDIKGRVQALRKEIDALKTRELTIRAEINALNARVDQVEDQIIDSRIINPVNGVVLTSFVEQHELVRQGQPLYRIANLDTLELRVYVSGAQLPGVALGQQVEVLVDKNASQNQLFAGRVSWVASDAEFTPKMIQTKEERVTQVYAVKIKVPNRDGILKIGMPGEVNFSKNAE